ncbi:stage III sporulation protein AE [Clostridium acetobutylicum]|uniref:Stage III sporulation protein AE, SpoIIIAE n=1 Tax=Clostridium acetobutylicum (strain ATCC 824 / DSM 792 / JCM 1419 / IAM 19013 / LMG 5710 / NBRC 13948 / NRRL B-527 / VKM B-1787 / 2291 / W) TaxID=272562 RepID=Q97HC3_CLOAB|nr:MULTISPECIES: stage III sporulation protein AE [Clostridium]AAK80048.1 Stage III sporulation protein AE, SpoIIIAE [Clostridium acetobutylicum ATCC 824]ADZ21140.1 Stage III sporulation protein AE, SpoIIIAE [Clostridium acetobutylicum EA 2018]AEI33750.1 stage III sporulation protein AE, SpoIIIAE [Clostridium acetobutylicum DSM 1731]AWV79524.1 stage III sporulation protein AE [Clostridium acetobutylicum]MBC2394502.1 stage III sporulation protein AE [Clostridium acetobutylicum]
MKKVILMFVVILILFPVTVQAYDKSGSDVTKENEQQIMQLYDYMTKIKGKYDVLKDLNIKDYVEYYMKNGKGNTSVSKFSRAVFSYFMQDITSCLKLVSTLVFICIVCALLTNLQKAFSSEKLTQIAYFSCYAIIIIIIAKNFKICVSTAQGAMKDISNMMGAVVPILLTLLISSGSLVESTVFDPVILFSINFTEKVFTDILIPLILLSFVLEFVNNLSEDYKISNLSKLLKRSVIWIQGIIMTVFIGIITIRGINAKAIDNVTAKTAKFAVDNFVPIVGKCLSDAISTVAGYSILLKNAIGTVGLIVLIVMIIFPVIKIFLLAFVHKIVAAFVEPISDKRIVNCLNSVGDCLILIGSCLIGVAVMFFIMIAIIIAAGKIV